jgi:hypothetical protein
MPDLGLIKQGEQGVVRGVVRPVRCVCYIIPDTSRIPPAVAHGIRHAIRLPTPLQFPDSFRLRPLVQRAARSAFCDLMT